MCWIQFPPLKNIKRLLQLFISQFWLFSQNRDINSQLLVIKSELRFMKLELRDINSHRKTDMFSELRVYLTVITRLLLTHNCEFISHNSDKKFIARKQVIIARYKLVIVREKSRVYITQLWGGKISELWDKKSQWTFLFFNQWRKRASILLPNARIKYNITHQT